MIHVNAKLVARMRPRLALLLAAQFILVTAVSGQSSSLDFELQNGLRVSLRRSINSKLCSLAVFYDFGNLSDPAGKSGMAHYAEHLYCTSATQASPSRTAEAFFRNYPRGANAQTGDRYTVFAMVFQPERLEKEIKDAADRMNHVSVTAEDLQREIPRLDLELENMFENIPQLSGPNQGKQLRLPLPHEGRRGGIIHELKAVSVEDMQSWLNEFYKPNNARLVVAGPVDIEETAQMIRDHFDKIPAGKRPPEPAQTEIDRPPATGTSVIQYSPTRGDSATYVTAVFAVPTPDDSRFPALVVAAARLQRSQHKLATNPNQYPVGFAVLDQPQFLTVTLPVAEEKSETQVIEQIFEFIDQQLAAPLVQKDIQSAHRTFGRFLNTAGDPNLLFANNIYGWALMTGRHQQLGIDASELKGRLDSLDQSHFEKVRLLFAPEMATIVTVKPK